MIKNILTTVAVALALLTQSYSAFGLVAGPAKIIGTVKRFDEKSVLVENDQSKYEIPKDFVGEKNLRSGNRIEITLSQEQVDKVKIEKKKSSKK